MEITYIGHSCFRIKGKDISIIIDPYSPEKTGMKLPKLSADVVCITHDHDDHAFIEGVSDSRLIIESAGEYEISDVFITGITTYHDDQSGTERGKNTIYQIDIDGFSILHLGDLGHELTKETLEKLGNIDILMIPVGGTYTINAKTAVKVISEIEPYMVVPMHYQTEDLSGLSKKLETLDEFLEEMGTEKNGVKHMDKLKISSRSDIPDETSVYVLSPQH